jgi:hypothetical protein
LPTPLGPTSRKRADRFARIVQAGAGGADAMADALQRVRLADYARAQERFQLQHGGDLVLQHLAHRDARPAGDHFAHQMGIHADPHQRRFALHRFEFRVQLVQFGAQGAAIRAERRRGSGSLSGRAA